jgi:hypothetical protein
VKLVRGFWAFGFVKLLRFCNLYHFVREKLVRERGAGSGERGAGSRDFIS